MPPIRQAGAITFRETSDGTEVLLVRAKREPHDWIFPKGHQEKGETLAETAVRELKEEGGVVGKPLKSVGVKVTYFLVRDTGRRAKPEREVTWRSFSAAKKLVAFEDARRLLDEAKRILKERR